MRQLALRLGCGGLMARESGERPEVAMDRIGLDLAACRDTPASSGRPPSGSSPRVPPDHVSGRHLRGQRIFCGAPGLGSLAGWTIALWAAVAVRCRACAWAR